MTTVTSAWASRRFRAVWGANVSATFGIEIMELAIPALALITLQASAQQLSWIRTATFLPYLVLTLWFGVVVDRRRRKPLLVGADAARAAILIVIGTCAFTGLLNVPVLVVGAFLVGAISVMHMLADFTFLPSIVGAEQLPDANARLTATQSAIGIGGSGVGGVLVQTLTAPVAIFICAANYLSSAILIHRVKVDEPEADRPSGNLLAQTREGLAALIRHRIVRALAAEATLWNLGNEIFMLALTVMLIGPRPNGVLALGLIMVAGGFGAFLGASISGRLTRRFGYGPALVAALLVGNTAPIVGVVLTRDTQLISLLILGAAFLLSGFGAGIANSQAVTVRQLTVPDHLRGRVNAGYRTISWGAVALGAILGGLIVTGFGYWPSAVLGTALMCASTLPVLFSPVRRMKEIEPAA